MRLDHVNIVVTDMSRAEQFYGGVLGLRRGFERLLEGEWIERVTGLPGARAHCVFYETEGGGRVELLQYLTPTGEPLPVNSLPQTPGVRHLAFKVDDLDALCTRLQAAGVPLGSPPVEVPFRVADSGRKRLCYFHDPEGVLLEVAEYCRDQSAPMLSDEGPPPVV
jgi:catechol 2,3-dioxygenase-like lactoylglutathione lyase family enzyme